MPLTPDFVKTLTVCKKCSFLLRFGRNKPLTPDFVKTLTVCKSRPVCCVFAALVLSAAILATSAVAPALGSARSDIDRKLLENPGTDPFDEFDLELFAPRREVQSEADPSRSDAASRENPFADIAERMRAVEQRLDGADSGEDTQNEQKRIVDRLDVLIEQMKARSGGQSGEEQKPGGAGERKKIDQSKKPGRGEKPDKGLSPGESTARGEVQDTPPPVARRADMRQINDIMKRLWGELPPRDRERMLQYPLEQFLPEYEQMIEEYYKRLSEEDNSP